jgi:hypothetical protein
MTMRFGNRGTRNYALPNSEDRTMTENTTEPVKTALVDKEGSTRGKNPRKVTFKVLNQIPKSIPEFMEVTGVKAENEIVELLYDGFNQASYAAASDEIGEFIPDSWDKDTANNFRLAVRNTSKLTGQSIEEVANFLLPGVEKGLAKKREQAEKEKAEAAKATTAAA